MSWICSDCKNKSTMCHISCDEFKEAVQKSIDRQRQIKLAIRRQKEIDRFIFDVHKNGIKHERSRRKSAK